MGEIHKTNQGYQVKIVEYLNATNITVEYEDGAQQTKVQYRTLLKGGVRKPVNHIGEIYTTNQGYKIEIVSWINTDKCDVKFLISGLIIKNNQYQAVRGGRICNPYHRSVCGIGYLGVIRKEVKIDERVHSIWTGIIERCSNEKRKEKLPTYKEATVCKEWECFKEFSEWYEENCKSNMKGWHLDKDILIKGNKYYSPETCRFVPQEINKLFTNRANDRGDLPVGVSRSGIKFCAAISINKVIKYLGIYDTIEEAFNAYKIAKELEIKEKADKWKIFIDFDIYEAMYNWTININD